MAVSIEAHFADAKRLVDAMPEGEAKVIAGLKLAAIARKMAGKVQTAAKAQQKLKLGFYRK